MRERKGKKKFAWNPKSKTLYNMMASTPGVVVISWIFQGMLGMDRTELFFHILFDLIIFSILAFALSLFVNVWTAAILSVFVAHSVNWVLNTHFWVMGRYIGISRTTKEEIHNYLFRVQKLAKRKSYLSGVAVFGNMTRGGNVKPTSDLDIRFISKVGLSNQLKTNIFGLSEKVKAFFQRFPLDLYVLDSIEPLGRLREDEIPLILLDAEGLLKEKYRVRGYRTFDMGIGS